MTPEKFLAKLQVQATGCIYFTGARDGKGYGHLYINGGRNNPRYEGAHRFAYRMVYGEIPAGKNVLHKCDKPLCCNPLHLFLGTQAENMRDASAKGRSANGNTKKQVCKRGHPLIAGNLYLAPNTTARQCRTCTKARQEKNKVHKKAQDAARYKKLREERIRLISEKIPNK